MEGRGEREGEGWWRDRHGVDWRCSCSIYSGYQGSRAVYNTMRVYGVRACSSTKNLSGERNNLKAKNTGMGGSVDLHCVALIHELSINQNQPRISCWDQIRSRYGVHWVNQPLNNHPLSTIHARETIPSIPMLAR